MLAEDAVKAPLGLVIARDLCPFDLTKPGPPLPRNPPGWGAAVISSYSHAGAILKRGCSSGSLIHPPSLLPLHPSQNAKGPHRVFEIVARLWKVSVGTS